jgi:hypothetical protein
MEFATFQYNQGWSIDDFPLLDSENTLIIAFASSDFKHNLEPFLALHKAYPLASIIGCSTAGEIFNAFTIDSSISVAVIRFDKTVIKCTYRELENHDNAKESGHAIINDLKGEGLRGIFVLSDGLHVNGTDLVEGLNSLNDPRIIITGGLAGDGAHYQETWTYLNGQLYKNHIVAVGFYGDNFLMGHGSKGGWDIFGPERRITKSEKNILFELDGQPALKLYKDYLGEMASGLPLTGLRFPLAIRKDTADESYVVRTLVSTNDENESVTFAGNMPSGYLAQLMRANFDRLISGASHAAELASKHLPKDSKPSITIAISCYGRKSLLGERTEEEVEAAMESYPTGTAQIGFYSYGEIAPVTANSCDFHSQTMTITVFQET